MLTTARKNSSSIRSKTPGPTQPPLRARPPSRLAIPDEAALAQATASIEGLLKPKEAESRSEKQDLAAKMIREGAKATNSDAERYVLLSTAADLATDADAWRSALDAFDALGEAFQVDVLPLKAKALTAIYLKGRKAAESAEIFQTAVTLRVEATKQDDYPSADRFTRVALEQAIEHGNAARARTIREYSRLIERGRREFERIVPTLEKLKQSPEDADANLAAGRYYCWFKNDWPKGLPMLAKGSDPKVKDLAAKDLARPSDPEALAAIGDGWWDLSEDQPSLQRTCLRSHACELYESALPGLTSLRRAAVRNRINEFHRDDK